MTAKRFNGSTASFSGESVREISVSVNDSIIVRLKDGSCIEAECITA